MKKVMFALGSLIFGGLIISVYLNKSLWILGFLASLVVVVLLYFLACIDGDKDKVEKNKKEEIENDNNVSDGENYFAVSNENKETNNAELKKVDLKKRTENNQGLYWYSVSVVWVFVFVGLFFISLYLNLHFVWTLSLLFALVSYILAVDFKDGLGIWKIVEKRWFLRWCFGMYFVIWLSILIF